ncbi:MAG: hypothetical protein PHH86_07075 [Sphaerochaetaceae bacterium]|nr:hypothetical protein [Sphaerochaetaceae bacterium]
MTDPIYFDTDCLSSFLWIKREHILYELYPGKLVVPYETYSELSKVRHLQVQTDNLIIQQKLKIEHIQVASQTFELFLRLTTPKKGLAAIGNGEAACIALAVIKHGFFASNNMRDIAHYVELYNLSHLTTAIILKEALCRSIITEAEGNLMWVSMLQRRRKLPNDTFSDYLRAHG